jgi:alpha-beta hydrolase superfamily lysophospholipase
VLLCHGLSANRWTVDSGVEQVSLAGFLAGAGFDCFALDLRGHGGSRRGPPGAGRRWSFDTIWNAGLADGFSADYGHTDLLVGRRASEEIFPRLRDWLVAHAEPRR